MLCSRQATLTLLPLCTTELGLPFLLSLLYLSLLLLGLLLSKLLYYTLLLLTCMPLLYSLSSYKSCILPFLHLISFLILLDSLLKPYIISYSLLIIIFNLNLMCILLDCSNACRREELCLTRPILIKQSHCFAALVSPLLIYQGLRKGLILVQKDLVLSSKLLSCSYQDCYVHMQLHIILVHLLNYLTQPSY